jgi:hypothetical protein
MASTYIINDYEIKDLIDLLCVAPPTIINRSIKRGNYIYINWSLENENLWVEAYVDKSFKYLGDSISAYLGQKSKICRIDYNEENATLENLIALVCKWCEFTGIYTLSVTKIEGIR